MHSDQLLYLIDISKTNSINATAKRMFSSQQAVSESIKHLERELNCTILNRSKTGVSLTNDGKYVLAHALRMIDEYNLLLQHFHKDNDKPIISGNLTIGVAPLATSTLLTDLLIKVHSAYPEIVLYAQEYPVETVLELLLEGKADFALLGSSQDWMNTPENIIKQAPIPLHFQKLYDDALVCVMSRNNPLSMQKMIMLQNAANLKKTMYNYSNKFVVDNTCLHISNNTDLHQKFMKEEQTICLMPYQTYNLLYPKKDFCCVPIADAHPVTTYLICREAESLSSNLLYQTFINTVVSFAQHI